MDELVGRLVANVGVDRGTAEKAVGIILDFLRKEGPPDKVQALIDRLPGWKPYSHNIRNPVARFPWAASWGPERK